MAETKATPKKTPKPLEGTEPKESGYYQLRGPGINERATLRWIQRDDAGAPVLLCFDFGPNRAERLIPWHAIWELTPTERPVEPVAAPTKSQVK